MTLRQAKKVWRVATGPRWLDYRLTTWRAALRTLVRRDRRG